MTRGYPCTQGNDLQSIGIWFLVTYLYSILWDENEQRYKGRPDYTKWCRTVNRILIHDPKVVIEWMNFIITDVDNDVKNKGSVSLDEQKKFAKKVKQLLENYVK